VDIASGIIGKAHRTAVDAVEPVGIGERQAEIYAYLGVNREFKMGIVRGEIAAKRRGNSAQSQAFQYGVS